MAAKHPFGVALQSHLRRGNHLTQSVLARDIGVDDSVVSRMCQGERLSDRSRILDIIRWLIDHGALCSEEEATQLLESAGHARLNVTMPNELGVHFEGEEYYGQTVKSIKSSPYAGIFDIHEEGLSVIQGYELWFSGEYRERRQIWHLDSATGTINPVCVELVGLHDTNFHQPTLSPSGNLLAFAAGTIDNLGRPKRDIFLASPQGSNVRKLIEVEVDAYHPAWSHDGEQLAFHAGLARTATDPGIDYGIWIADVGEQRSWQLTDTMDYDPSWSPDGSCIACHSIKSSWHIKILESNARFRSVGAVHTWRGVEMGHQISSVSWVSNHRIVFAARIGQKWDIYSMPVKRDKTYVNPEPLTSSIWDSVYPSVFDGKILLWQAYRHEPMANEGHEMDRDAEIYVMDLKDRNAVPLVTGIGNVRDGFLHRKSV